jgi:hypothetical protein
MAGGGREKSEKEATNPLGWYSHQETRKTVAAGRKTRCTTKPTLAGACAIWQVEQCLASLASSFVWECKACAATAIPTSSRQSRTAQRKAGDTSVNLAGFGLITGLRTATPGIQS